MQRCHVGIDITGRFGKIATIGMSGGQARLQAVHDIRTSNQSIGNNDEASRLTERLPVAAETCRWIASASVPTHWIECHTVPTGGNAISSNASGKTSGKNEPSKDCKGHKDAEGSNTSEGISRWTDDAMANITSVSWTTRPDAPAESVVYGNASKLIQFASAIESRGYEVARLLPRSIAVQSAAKSLLGIDCVATIIIEDDGVELVVNQNDGIGLIRNYPTTTFDPSQVVDHSRVDDLASPPESASSNQREIADRIDQAIQYAAREDRSIYDRSRPILIAGSGVLDSGWDRTLARHLNRPIATWKSQLEIHGKSVLLDASYAVAVSLAWSGYADEEGASDD